MNSALIHPTWLELKPNEDLYGNQESFDDYYNRINQTKFELGKFPKAVYEQWIHPHHKDNHTLSNYSWINFELIEFKLVEFSYEELKNIHVIESFKPYTNSRGNYKSLEEFCCIEKDLENLKNNGTWRTPPIILDIKSLTENKPEWSDLGKNLQLVEGHSRFGYLNSMKTIKDLGKEKISEMHKVYLMTKLRLHNTG